SRLSKTASILAESVLSSTTRIRSGIRLIRALLGLNGPAGPTCQARDGGREFGRVDGLDDLGLEAGEQGSFSVLDAGERGKGGGGDVPRRMARAHLVNEIIPVLFGHANIAHDHVGLEPFDEFPRLGR